MKKFITKFDTTTELTTFSTTTDFGRPHVSLTEDGGKVHYFGDHYNGLEYVDLGLPSGIKWATCNLGAKRPVDCGLLFAWGETTGYNINDNHNFQDENNYNGPSDELILPNINNDYIIPAGYDAATVGDKWRLPRIPTKADFEELMANCVYEYDMNYGEIFGVFDGYYVSVFTSRNNGNSIIIPTDSDELIGKYWTSSGFADYDSYTSIQTYYYDNNSGNPDIHQSPKYEGCFIRPVCE